MKKQVVKVYDLTDPVSVETSIAEHLNQGYYVVHMTQSGSGTMTYVSNVLTVLFEMEIS